MALDKPMTALEVLMNKSDLVKRAHTFMRRVHNRNPRPSGSSYLEHYIAVANQLAEWNMDEVTVAAGLLHDVIEDTGVSLHEVELEFGEDVKNLVDGVTRLGGIEHSNPEFQAETLRKMIIAMAKDLRVIFIKLASRKDNMRTIGNLNPDLQRSLSMEILEIYAPLAHRLGMQKVSGELEDAAFPYIYPDEYQWLQENISERYEEREKYLKNIKPILLKKFRENKLEPIEIDFRAKRYASLYKKLLRYDMDIDKVYDLVAFRIILKDLKECYEALGFIHEVWPPLPGRIKDYIASPKSNGYQSLHTTVMGPDLKIIEFQIRTEKIHDKVENGLAAQWAYAQQKGTKKYLRRKDLVANPKEAEWVQKLRSWQKEYSDPKEFLDSLKIDFFKDRIFVLTPKGEVVDLPQGSTLIDFAYQIHSDIGNQCVGAKVNGRIVPLDYNLKSQDVVEIITQKNKKPSPSWLDFVVTSNAKTQIKKALRSKNNALRERVKQTELKVIIDDRLGLLKDITAIIARSRINITSINSMSDNSGKYHTIKIKCNTADKDKVWKLILKLKKLDEVKEIDYRFV